MITYDSVGRLEVVKEPFIAGMAKEQSNINYIPELMYQKSVLSYALVKESWQPMFLISIALGGQVTV